MKVLAFAALAILAKSDWANISVNRDIRVIGTGVVITETLYTVKKSKGDASFKFFVTKADSVGSVKVLSDGVLLKLGHEFHLETVSKNVARYAVDTAVHDGSKVKVITACGSGLLEPFPATALELEAQKVLLSVPLLVTSPHAIEEQSTEVRFTENSLLSFLPLSGKQEKNKLIFGPFTQTSAGETTDEIKLHFAFNKPLPFISSLVKTIDISHWGALISVNEQVTLWNNGANLEGEFNRIPHTVRKYGQQSPYVMDHSLFSVDAVLPGNVENLHYRDVIGNVSSSLARREAGYTVASLFPRFPLLGGWKVEFNLIYSIPFSGGFVQSRGKNEFLLSLPLAHAFTNVFSKKTELRLLLPSGATDIEVLYPGMDEKKIQVSSVFGWLDTPLLGPGSGHTVLSISLGPQFYSSNKDAVSPDLLVKYTLPPVQMFRAPLLLSLYIFGIFALFILYRRIVLQITNAKELEEIGIRDSDHDVCQKISDEITNLKAANSILFEEVASKNITKTHIEKLKTEYLETHEQTCASVSELTEEFQAEPNRNSRTKKIFNALSLMKDNAMGLLDSASAGKDKVAWEAKLVETEMEINAVLEKVEAFAPPTPLTGGTNSATSSRATSSAAPVRKRK